MAVYPPSLLELPLLAGSKEEEQGVTYSVLGKLPIEVFRGTMGLIYFTVHTEVVIQVLLDEVWQVVDSHSSFGSLAPLLSYHYSYLDNLTGL